MKPSTLLFVTTAGIITTTLILSIVSIPNSFILYSCVLWGIMRVIILLGALQQSHTLTRTPASLFFASLTLLSLVSSLVNSDTIFLSLSDIYGPLFFLLLFVFSLNIKDKSDNNNIVSTRQNRIISVIMIMSIISAQCIMYIFPHYSHNQSDKPLISILLLVALHLLIKPLIKKKYSISLLQKDITTSILQTKDIHFIMITLLLTILVLVTTFESIQFIAATIPFYEGLLVSFSTWKESIVQLFVGTSPSEYPISFYKFHSIGFNNSSHWDVIIENASSFISQIATTTGLLGLVAFIGGIAYSYRQQNESLLYKFLILILIFSLLVSPPSLVLIALIALLTGNSLKKDTILSIKTQQGISILGIGLSIVMSGFVLLLSLADIFYYSAISLLNQGKGMQALDFITQTITMTPFKPQYYFISSRIYQDASLMLTESDRQYNLNDYWQLSIASAKKATEIAPKNPQTWQHLGQIYSMFSSSNSSVAVWQQAAYQQAIRHNPRSPLLFISLGDVYAEQKDIDEAIVAYEEAIRLKKNYITGYYRLGLLYEQQSNWKASLQYYTQAYRLLDQQSPEKILIEEKIKELQYFLTSTNQTEEQGDFSLPQLSE